ncbi:MAG: hypothetical protein ACRDRN_13795 [Sciscionella sp.]
MAEAISDRQVVAVLRPFVRGAGPVLDGLRDSDPFGLRTRIADTAVDTSGVREKVLDFLSGMKVPGTAAWAGMDLEQRCEWWTGRVGRFTAALAAIPGIGGALADRLPITDTLGAAGQGLLLCAIAGEYGVTDTGARVRLLAAVLFERRIDPALAAGQLPDEQRQAEELAGDLGEGTASWKSAAKAVYRLGRALWSLADELDKRPRGRFYHRALGLVPVVGVVGDYLGERAGLKRATRSARAWIELQAVAEES